MQNESSCLSQHVRLVLIPDRQTDSYLEKIGSQTILNGTYRPVEVILNEHPLKGIKQDLQMHKLCCDLPLEYLSRESVGDYLNNKFPANSFPTRLAEMIHRHTEGNPLFMVNVVDYLTDLDLILEKDGTHQKAVPLDEIELGLRPRRVMAACLSLASPTLTLGLPAFELLQETPNRASMMMQVTTW